MEDTTNSGPKTFTIDRGRWRFGGSYREEWGDTRLLNHEGYLCCLGFWSLSCGLSPEDIKDFSECCRLPLAGKFPSWFMDDFNLVEDTFMVANDNPYLKQDEREKLLTKLFADHGVELVFTGEYPSFLSK